VLLTLASPGQAPATPVAEEELGVWLGEKVFLAPRLQYRPRYLVHGGKDFAPQNVYNVFSHRARLGVEARILGWLSVGFQLQDVRAWGEELSTMEAVADGLDLHLAWIEGRCPLGLSLRVGRQEVSFDNERLIGAVDWSDQGRVFDGVRLGYRRRALELDLLYAKTAERNVFAKDAQGKTVRGAPEDSDLAALRLRYARFAAARPTLLAIYDYQGAIRQHRVTAGLYLDGEPARGLRWNGEFYYQAGRRSNASSSETLAATLGTVGVSYTLPVRTAPGLGLWFEHLSGDDDAKDGKLQGFDTLFATNHKFYGFMDLFINIPTDTGGMGLVDVGGRAFVEPWKGLTIFLDFHHFEQARKHPVTGTTTLGNELDLLARYKLNRHLSVEGVAAMFLPRLGLSNLRGGGREAEAYGYLQLDLKL
jgi:hypothetical protein